MTDEELNEKFSRLVDAQLRFQDQLGEMARLMREDRQEQARINEAFRQRHIQHDEEMERFRQRIDESNRRHEENEQRFNVLLEEIRFLIRQQRPPAEDNT